MSTSRQQLFSTASVLFFLSGSTGLAYEVIWFRRFSHVWGSSTLAMASVVASFLLGLGLGAYLWGRRADRLNAPLRWYGICELAIGVLAGAIPFVMPWLSDLSASLYPSLNGQPVVHFLVQFGLTFLTIGPVCVLMGGTLPLLVREFTARDGSLTEATGWLYAINTFGAATGCYVTGFHLLPTLGLYWTNNAAAILNLAIGVVAVMAAKSTVAAVQGEAPVEQSPEVAAAGAPAAVPWRTRGVYLAALLTGASALILQMAWSRQLSLVVGGSTYAFSATVFVVLLGIACGSLIYHVYLRTREQHTLRAYTWVILLIAISTAIGMQNIPPLCSLAGDMRGWRDNQLSNALFCAGTSALVEFLPALGMGILFPLLVQLTHRSANEAGKTVGNVYFWNTVGSILGATLTSAVLVPWLGSYGTATLAVAMYFLALVVVVPAPSKKTAMAWLGGAVAAALSLGIASLEPDPRSTNLGMFLYGPEAGKAMDNSDILLYREGPAANVLVLGQGEHRTLRVNGKVDASNSLDMQTQAGSAYVPRIFQPHAKEVLVIGFGSGTTPGASLLFPETRVTCVEIEPAVYEASEFFGDVNHRPHESDRFEMVIGDGRTYVQGTDKKFDLIISEPSNPWMAGVSALFTSEYFRAARERLNKGGVLAQWMQTYHFTIEEYALVVRTLRSVFPHVGVVTLSGGADTVLLASDRPLIPTAEEVGIVQAQVEEIPAIKNDLKKYFHTTNLSEILLSTYRLSTVELNLLTKQSGSDALNTDLNLRLEFDAPLRLFSPAQSQDDMAQPQIARAMSPGWLDRLSRELGRDPKETTFLVDTGKYIESMNQTDQAMKFYELALRRDPSAETPRLQLAAAAFKRNEPEKAARILADLLRQHPANTDALYLLGQIFERQRKYSDAVKLYRRALEIVPESDAIGNNLAWLLATCGDESVRDGEEAVRVAQPICERDGYKKFEFVDTLAAACAEAGNFAEAVRLAEDAQESAVEANNAQMAEQIGSRLRLYEAGQPYHEG
ncbi:MAG: fused MFS/spermidine synthase [Pirellulales bacterium]|nr:fused MFS/spermidine synthase [Pirellulales bacterium]